tara:strand:- start:253 stop:450 length:198 start_codon:yes stop_codon:yes gene_type:complete
MANITPEIEGDLLKLYLGRKSPKLISDYKSARKKEKDFIRNFKFKNKGGKISKYYKAGGNVITGR